MVKVFHIGAKLVLNGVLQEQSNAHIIVGGDSANILKALEIAQDIAEYNLGFTFEYLKANGDCMLYVYPLDGGVGIPYSRFIEEHSVTKIINIDDLYDMEFDFQDLPKAIQKNVIDNFRDVACSGVWWYMDECIPAWRRKAKDEYGIEIDKDKVHFMLNYTQSDYARVTGTVCDFEKFFKHIGIDYSKDLKKRLILKRIIGDGCSSITIGDKDYYHNIGVSLNVDLNSHFNVWSICNTRMWLVLESICDDVDKAVEDLQYELNNELYWHIRNYYENNVDTDENIIGYIEECTSDTFRFDGELI